MSFVFSGLQLLLSLLSLLVAILPRRIVSFTTIDGLWSDDLALDGTGDTGWAGTTIQTGGIVDYHGWFHLGNVAALYRDFRCAHFSDVTVTFTLNWGCEVEPNKDSFDFRVDASQSWTTMYYTFASTYNITGEALQSGKVCHSLANDVGFRGEDFSYGAYQWLASQTFRIEFTSNFTSGITNEFAAISKITVRCTPVVTNPTTANPTMNPTTDPTNNYPTLGPTMDPTNDPTHDPTTDPASESDASVPTSAPTLMQLTADQPSSQELKIGTDFAAKFPVFIAILCAVVITVVLAYLYFITYKKRLRKIIGQGSIADMWRALGALQRISVMLELLDIATDFSFAITLIRTPEATGLQIGLGWSAFVFGCIGAVLCVTKLLLMRKLFFIFPALRARRKHMTENDAHYIGKREFRTLSKIIRRRQRDIMCFDLLIGAAEDLPQFSIIIVLAVAQGFRNLSTIAWISFSSSACLLLWRGVRIVLNVCGLFDDRVNAREHQSIIDELLEREGIEDIQSSRTSASLKVSSQVGGARAGDNKSGCRCTQIQHDKQLQHVEMMAKANNNNSADEKAEEIRSTPGNGSEDSEDDNGFAFFLDWLANTVGLEVYLEHFCNAGYVSMASLAGLRSEHLSLMDITDADHQSRIVRAISNYCGSGSGSGSEMEPITGSDNTHQ